MQFHSLLLLLSASTVYAASIPNEDIDAVGTDFAALDEVSAQAACTNNVKGSTCRYFGTAPFCKGKCPGGWDTLYKTRCGGMGDKCCFTGQKACRCRNFNR